MTVKILGTAEVAIDELVGYPGNARRGKLSVVRESIEKLGQFRPLVVRQREGKPLMILAGNTTKDALVAAGYVTARVEILECSDDEARQLNLIDNRSQELAEWDTAALVAQLELGGGDFTGTGFSVEDFDKLAYGGAGRDDREIPEDEPGWQILFDCQDEENQAEWLAWFATEHRVDPPPPVTGEARPLIRS